MFRSINQKAVELRSLSKRTELEGAQKPFLEKCPNFYDNKQCGTTPTKNFRSIFKIPRYIFQNGLAWDERKKDTLVATQPMNKAKIKTLF